MFARTKRLTLRPVWPDDAAAVALAIGHESVGKMLTRVPFPYCIEDAEAFACQPRASHEPSFVILSHDAPVPMLIGGIALTAQHDPGAPELGYWLTPSAWGRGYATEAAHAVIEMARHALPLRQIEAWHFADNPASGAVLRKIGFRANGRNVMKPSLARGVRSPSIGYELDLQAGQASLRIAA